MVLVPAMTLNRMYHWMPSTISGDSQMSGLSDQVTITDTTSGNRILAGKAGKKCATGCTIRGRRGGRPTKKPPRGQNSDASAISTQNPPQGMAPPPKEGKKGGQG